MTVSRTPLELLELKDSVNSDSKLDVKDSYRVWLELVGFNPQHRHN